MRQIQPLLHQSSEKRTMSLGVQSIILVLFEESVGEAKKTIFMM